MNFFESQDRARGETKKLIFLFIIAVLATAVVVAIALSALFFYNDPVGKDEVNVFILTRVMQSEWTYYIFIIVAIFIFITSFIKILLMGKGGEYIAMMAGAQPVLPDTNDPLEKKYVNIVQEMSLAAGIPVPKIYIMKEEQGINAFAAGFEIDDAVVAVTQGCLEQLNRDELQGVVAHEFGHIFNGDMKINLRLIGFLF